MGAPKKPMAVRELHGTAHRNKQRNNDDAPQPERGIGPAPSYFTEAEVEVWDYLVTIMHDDVLKEPDRPTFEVLAKLFYRFRYGTFDKEATIPALMAAELNKMVGIMSLYGMTPADREKIKVKKKSERNPFDVN